MKVGAVYFSAYEIGEGPPTDRPLMTSSTWRGGRVQRGGRDRGAQNTVGGVFSEGRVEIYKIFILLHH